MKKLFFGGIVLLISLIVGITMCEFILAKELVLCDFNNNTKFTNLGTKFDSWDKDPEDHTQSCSFVLRDEKMIISYDVDSPNPAYNGIWMQLNNLDISNYKYLIIKAQRKKGSPYFSIELKGNGDKKKYNIGLNNLRIKEIKIDLDDLDADIKKNLSELVIVFDDVTSLPLKRGVIEINEISFSDSDRSA